MDIHNSSQVWISMTALWVCSVMDINIQLWQPILATNNTIIDIRNDNSDMDIHLEREREREREMRHSKTQR